MAKRRANFDPPTQADFDLLGVERVRRAPKGGFIWLCEIDGCKQAASHLSMNTGRKVCRSHGGSTAASRDPVQRAEKAAAGEKVPTSPGRPVKHGFYSEVPGARVDERVAEYREQQLNPDATDDDMLYMRAYLDELKLLRPDAMEAASLLQAALPLVKQFRSYISDVENETTGRNLPLSRALDMIGELQGLDNALAGLRDLLRVLLAVTGGIEERHANLIGLAKVRAETRLKDSAAQQLDAFTTMIQRLEMILGETLPSNLKEALMTRFTKELLDVSAQAVTQVRA